MKNNTYQNAVEHLEFSKDLYKKVMENAPEPKRPVRMAGILAAAVLLTALLASAVFADNTLQWQPPVIEESTVPMVTLGTAQEEIADANWMELTVSDMTDGVTVHYMELDPLMRYTFCHGMLYGWKTGFQRITEDYEFEQVQMRTVDISLEKNDRVYTDHFDYLITDEGVLSSHKSIYQMNENGEIFFVVTDGDSSQWPVYLNVYTGDYRDALPDWSASDFEGRVGYAYQLKGGILVCTLVEKGKESYNEYLWIDPGASEAKRLNVPKKGFAEVYHDTIYYQNEEGHLYVMDDNFNFQLMAQYETMDTMTNGLLTVVTDEGKLGILDVVSGITYVFPEIDATVNDIDELHGYNAQRYGPDGTIALVQKDWIPQQFRIALLKLCILDPESGELLQLEIENEFDGLHSHWLDTNRYGVIYETEDRQFLAIYEFE